MSESKNNGSDKSVVTKQLEKIVCGLVMPISPIDGCSAEHWSEVKDILCESLECSEEFNISTSLVSDADDVGVIQKRIVQNLYSNDLVICDVSAKNPNVMFELGMRLAFDKPTIIVKDDKTDYTFDTGVIEHITYPRDLRFQRIKDFKITLRDKAVNTLKRHRSSTDSTSFLKNFGKFNVASIDEKEVPAGKLVIGMLEDLQQEVSSLRRRVDISNNNKRETPDSMDGLPKLTALLSKELNGKGSDEIVRLLDDEEFSRSVLMKFDAPKYFPTKRDYDRALDLAMRAFI